MAGEHISLGEIEAKPKLGPNAAHSGYSREQPTHSQKEHVPHA